MGEGRRSDMAPRSTAQSGPGLPSPDAMNRHGHALLRYDDGDTRISDGLRLQGTRLLRTMNVVTDELYTDRQLFAYERRA